MMRAILANAVGATTTLIVLAIAARSASDWSEFVPILVISAVSALILNALLVAEAARERARLRGVALRAIRVSDEDRRRMARDVNGEAAQTLASALLHLKAAPAGSNPERQESIRDARGAIIATMERLQKEADDLHPALLELLGTEAALLAMARGACERAGLELHGEIHPLGRLGDDSRLALTRVVQEAIDNVVDHARATELRLTTHAEGNEALVSVADDGRGFNVRSALRMPDAALGLSSMRELAAYWGGSVRIESRSGTGTRVDIRFPLNQGFIHG